MRPLLARSFQRLFDQHVGEGQSHNTRTWFNWKVPVGSHSPYRVACGISGKIMKNRHTLTLMSRHARLSDYPKSSKISCDHRVSCAGVWYGNESIPGLWLPQRQSFGGHQTLLFSLVVWVDMGRMMNYIYIYYIYIYILYYILYIL